MEHSAERAVTEQVSFIGLGHLGLPMALYLQESGWNLAVFNRTPRKATPVVESGAVLAEKPADCVTRGGIVVSVLWDSDAVESVVTEGDFLERLGSGVHVCMCTGSPEGAKRLSELHAKNSSLFVEAPVFGRPEAAARRQLWIPIGGPQAAKDRILAILTGMGAQGIFDFGKEAGAATVVKLLGNLLIISATRSLVEGLSIAEHSGVDVRQAVEMLTTTIFNAPIYQNYGRMIAERRAPFPSTIPVKDLGLFSTLASNAALPHPIAELLVNLVREQSAASK